MLMQATLQNLRSLKLSGMARELESQMHLPEMLNLNFEERLGMIVDAQLNERDTRRLRARIKNANIPEAACIEDIDWQTPRKLDRSIFLSLATLQWCRLRRNLLIIGPTGIGKSYLACALAQKACRDGLTVRHERAGPLFKSLGQARVSGDYFNKLAAIAKTDLLIVDDFGLRTLNEEARLDLLEIMEVRYEKRSTLITSQFSSEHWHRTIGDPTIADAILDRLVHNAHTLELDGESIRKKKGKKNMQNQ
jgi:DNA replication protein DnaC